MLTRREFLEAGAAAATGTVLCGEAVAHDISPGSDYRALVCVVLGGGADSFNMLVPADARPYRNYLHRRGDLALERAALLPLNRGDSEGRSYAMHPAMGELHQLYLTDDVAVLANAGPFEPTPLRSGRNRTADPTHIEFIRQWHEGSAGVRTNSGWLGRMADVLHGPGSTKTLPMNVSMSGRNLMQLGANTVAVNLDANPYRQRLALTAGVDFFYVNEQLVDRALATSRPGRARHLSSMLDGTDMNYRPIVDEALAHAPALETRFQPDWFSADLERVARIIALHKKLGVRRQVFFVHLDGWDDHSELLGNQAVLLSILSRGLATFGRALQEIGAYENVTTFTVSEFARSLESNGSGADHGWGGHHLLMGGAVRGGQVYGHYPDLAVGNVLDAGGGCYLPTTSMDAYLAELALWFGLPPSELSYVLPGLSRFWSAGDPGGPIGVLA